jgi:hypothetical protein
VTRATKDARKSGTVLGVSVKACRRASSHRQVCKVTTRVGQAAGERTCQVRYRVTLKGHKARAKRIGSAKCTTAGGSAVAPPGSVSHPATPPQPGDAPPAQGEEHDPFNDCWAGCA